LYLLLLLFSPLIRCWGGRYGYGLEQRFGWYPDIAGNKIAGCRTVWIHASSVGEAQAAIILIIELLRTGKELQIILTSATEQGNRVARGRLPESVFCLMAPFDAPLVVRRTLRTLRPDVYICLETELWPVLLTAVREAGIPMLLLNGRLSERSYSRYQWIRPFMRSLLQGFDAIAVISAADGQRFSGLGFPESRIQVCGNLKYDMPAAHPEEVRALCRRRLGISRQMVFICGSTHEGEEEMLLPVFRQLAASFSLIWVVVPRHLERLSAVTGFFRRSGLDYDRYSDLATKARCAEVVLVDTMGELADLYAGGDFIFCGGSLVERGGHNVMEAARWGRPVYFGPYMKDFRDAAELLTAAGGGFQVADASELATLLLHHHAHPEKYQTACAKAAAMAAEQRGAVERQAGIVSRLLASRGKEGE
jgi:3-deoxy-D-manno-octulosonic-acid transferase